MTSLRFTLNGRPVEADVSPTTTLLQHLRATGHTGCKEGCAEGDCGACTVAVLDEHAPGGPAYRAIDSCLVLLPMVEGKRVVTVEGLREGDRYHPAQQSMVEEMGSQCGYCTPGIVMSLFEACYREPLSDWQLDDQLAGNLCRCTGYRPIASALRRVAGRRPEDRFRRALTEAAAEAPAPPSSLAYQHGAQRWFRPASFEELFDILDAHPGARFVAGGTDLALEVTKRFQRPPLLVSVEALPGLRGIERREGGVWRIGAATPLSDVEEATAERLVALHRMLRFFGARQIKNRGTLGGNLCTASPIDDHRGSAWYRRTVARNLLLGFFHETARTPAPGLPYRPTATVIPEATP
jgi:xanthine dehydrogenase small subunit